MTERAQKIYDAWEKEYCLQKPFYEHRALAAAIRKIIYEFEQYVENDTSWEAYFVSSNDLYILSNELEKLE